MFDFFLFNHATMLRIVFEFRVNARHFFSNYNQNRVILRNAFFEKGFERSRKREISGLIFGFCQTEGERNG